MRRTLVLLLIPRTFIFLFDELIVCFFSLWIELAWITA